MEQLLMVSLCLLAMGLSQALNTFICTGGGVDGVDAESAHLGADCFVGDGALVVQAGVVKVVHFDIVEHVIEPVVMVAVGVGEHHIVEVGDVLGFQEGGERAGGRGGGPAVYQGVLAAGQLYVDGVALAHIKEIDIKPGAGAEQGGVLGYRGERDLNLGGGGEQLAVSLRASLGGKMEYG
jgi:hypothetical protein